jgi:hypothetical protein
MRRELWVGCVSATCDVTRFSGTARISDPASIAYSFTSSVLSTLLHPVSRTYLSLLLATTKPKEADANMIQNTLLSNFIVQLCLAILAVAAPIADKTLATTDHGNVWQYGTGGGILGFIVLILDIIVFGAFNHS